MRANNALAEKFSSLPIPSLRLALYCGLLSLLWVATAFAREFGIVAILANMLLLLIALLDLVLSPQPHEFEIERVLGDKMNLGVPNVVAVEAVNRAGIPMTLTLRDEPPVSWPVTLRDEAPAMPAPRSPVVVPRGVVETKPRDIARFEYSITPTRRGVWQWGALSFRYASRLGFWFRQKRLAPPRGQETLVRVYPNTTDVSRYELLLRQGRLRDIGLHIQRLRGKGSEYESLREYTSGDDYRDVNWKASARRGKLIATNYEIERDQTVIIAIDCGRMMTSMATMRHADHAPSDEDAPILTAHTPLSKLDCAINAAVLLSHVSASMGDAVGVLLFADSVFSFVPPRKGRLQTGAIIESLYAAQPSLVEPDYMGAYRFLLARKLRRALVVTFTDIIDPEASRELIQASGILRRHHNALCVTINNLDVIELAQMMPQSSDEVYDKAMAQQMLTQRGSALENLRQRGVSVLDVEASQLTVATVNRYLDLKSRGAL